ncbi:MAG: hypothetical protein LC795_09660 [Acidobacteria bacterium]|nr:hypothetical protein [Acidobacteriota bacterium]
MFFLVFAFAGATAHAVTVTRTSSPVFYYDTSITPQLRCMYVSYRVTNDGAYLPNVYATAGSFTGGVISLAPNEDGVVHLGAMNAGESKMAFFYLQAAGTGDSVVPQTHTVRVYSGNPSAGAPQIGSALFTMTPVLETIKANANKVTTVLSGPNPATLGGTLTMTVTGDTGTIGAAKVLAFTPATYTGWAANSYELYQSTITLSGSNTGTYANQLLIPPASITSTGDTAYEAVYLFRAVNFTSGPTAVSPVNYISSGTQVKHTDTSGYASLSPVQQITNTTVITKLVNTAVVYNATVVTYTARLTNSGSADVQIDQVVDTLPTSPAAVTYVANSSTYNGASIPEPAVTGSTLTWARTFTVPAGSTRDLTYQVNIPSTAGTYTNRVVGNIATVQIDTTLNVNDNSPAQRDVLATTPPSVGLRKCVFVGGTCVETDVTVPTIVAGSDLVYSISFSNTGGYQASNFVIRDQIPSNTDFKVGSVTSSLGTTGLTVAAAYSNDGGTTWAYTPASGTGGAPAGYDRTVTHVRWTFTGNLSQTAPNNAGSVGFTTRIR